MLIPLHGQDMGFTACGLIKKQQLHLQQQAQRLSE